ncbi:MAG: hypothetical protein JST47_05575 [Bacteroidetes bacterium]|nr:hypothetical protein [Bacteroidota bacterium]MBS1975125.1 hypothetical protein [Bacteroidota bacterium]
MLQGHTSSTNNSHDSIRWKDFLQSLSIVRANGQSAKSMDGKEGFAFGTYLSSIHELVQALTYLNFMVDAGRDRCLHDRFKKHSRVAKPIF